jgi:hypothetical protein
MNPEACTKTASSTPEMAASSSSRFPRQASARGILSNATFQQINTDYETLLVTDFTQKGQGTMWTHKSLQRMLLPEKKSLPAFF